MLKPKWVSLDLEATQLLLDAKIKLLNAYPYKKITNNEIVKYALKYYLEGV